MNITPVKTEKEYKATLKRIEELWNAKEGTPQADEMEVLFTLTEAYEAKHHPIGPPDPA